MPARDKRKDPWYKDGLRFECRRCGRCCGGFPGYVWITEDEIGEAAGHLGISAEEFVEQYARRHGVRCTLKEVDNWNCIMLRDAEGDPECRIYPVRPAQCRTFPFWDEKLQEEEYWDAAAKDCPGMNRGRLYTLEEIERLRAERSG